MSTSETKVFQAEIKQLLGILIHSLYTEREIFLRELISNASDALHRTKFEMLTNQDVHDADAELVIRISSDPEEGTLTISDTGIGMTHDELVSNLGTIAHSGAASFISSLEQGQESVDQIGQFGVGFYSVFMVADEVSVTSRSYRPDADAWNWQSDGGNTYSLEAANKATRGTEIVIKLKEDATEFANDFRIKQAIHKHSDFVSFPIYLGDEEKSVNRQQAIWRQSPSTLEDDAANEFYQQLTLDQKDPTARIHVNTDAPVQIYALLYVPSGLERGFFSLKQDFGLRLYSHKIRIQENAKDLLPNYLRFIDGVVDSDDIPLNVSREAVQTSPVMARIKKVLTGRVLNYLSITAEKTPEQYASFWAEFGPFIKEGAATEYGDQEKLTPLLRFFSTRSDGQLISLNDYIGRVAASQKQIYYIVGEDVNTLQHSPHLDYFRKKDIEVLFFSDPLDAFLPSSLREYEGFGFQNVDAAGIDLPDAEEDSEQDPVMEEDVWQPLVERFKAQLGARVQDVRRSDLLVEHPARLVSGEGADGSEMDRVRRMMDVSYEMQPKILELNPRHVIVANLASMIAAATGDDVIVASIEQIYENGLLLEGIHPNPAEMVDRIQTLMEAATRLDE